MPLGHILAVADVTPFLLNPPGVILYNTIDENARGNGVMHQNNRIQHFVLHEQKYI